MSKIEVNKNYKVNSAPLEGPSLPKNIKKKITKINKYKIWVYGEPFAGKTYFADTFEDTIFLNTDANVNYITSQHVTIRSYEHLVGLIDELEADTTYKTIAVDLVEDVYTIVRNFVYKEQGITHETDKSFGLGWDLVRSKFLNLVQRVVTIDKNVIFLSHTAKKHEEINGLSREVLVPNLNKKFRDKLLGFFDFLVLCRKVTNVDGEGKVTYSHELTLRDSNVWTGFRPPMLEEAKKGPLKCLNDFPSFEICLNNSIDYGELNKIKSSTVEKLKIEKKLEKKVEKKEVEKTQPTQQSLDLENEGITKDEVKKEIKKEVIKKKANTIDLDSILLKENNSAPTTLEQPVLSNDNSSTNPSNSNKRVVEEEVVPVAELKKEYANGWTEEEAKEIAESNGIPLESLLKK